MATGPRRAQISWRSQQNGRDSKLDVARIFGPYPAIEVKLSAALLNRQFNTHFAIRRGSLLRKQAEDAIAFEDAEGDALSPDENRAAYSTTLVEPIKKDEITSVGDDILWLLLLCTRQARHSPRDL